MTVRKWLGVDLVDFLIQFGVTISLMAFVEVSGGPDEAYSVIVAASLVVLGVRRHRALRRRQGEISGEFTGDRLAEVEGRLGDLEILQDRVLELEERLDFAERLLAKRPEPAGRLPEPK